MIRLIREGSTKYPWILKFVVLVIAVTFTIGMGWFGYETSQQPNVVAMVGSYQWNWMNSARRITESMPSIEEMSSGRKPPTPKNSSRPS